MGFPIILLIPFEVVLISLFPKLTRKARNVVLMKELMKSPVVLGGSQNMIPCVFKTQNFKSWLTAKARTRASLMGRMLGMVMVVVVGVVVTMVPGVLAGKHTPGKGVVPINLGHPLPLTRAEREGPKGRSDGYYMSVFGKTFVVFPLLCGLVMSEKKWDEHCLLPSHLVVKRLCL